MAARRSARTPEPKPAGPRRRTPARNAHPFGTLTPGTVRALVPEAVYARGVRYAEVGAVVALTWRGAELHAAVEGSAEAPYRVAVRRVARGRAAGALDTLAAVCTCPYMSEWDGWCKHVVAVLLVASGDPDGTPRQPTVAELVAAHDRAALVRLLGALVERAPELYDLVADIADTDSGVGRRARSRRRSVGEVTPDA